LISHPHCGLFSKEKTVFLRQHDDLSLGIGEVWIPITILGSCVMEKVSKLLWFGFLICKREMVMIDLTYRTVVRFEANLFKVPNAGGTWYRYMCVYFSSHFNLHFYHTSSVVDTFIGTLLVFSHSIFIITLCGCYIIIPPSSHLPNDDSEAERG